MDHTTIDQKNKKWVVFGIVYAVVSLLVLILINLDALNLWLGELFRVLRPLIIGLVLAYMCNPLFRLFERRCFYKIRPYGLRRIISLIMTYVVVMLIILFFFLLLIPQVVSSILSFVENYDVYFQSLIDGINGFIETLNQKMSGSNSIPQINPEGIRNAIAGFFSTINIDTIMNFLKSIDIGSLGRTLGSIFGIVTDTIFGFFISLYLLHSKEKNYAHFMRIRKAFFSDSVNRQITNICDTANRSFGGFFKGKLLDSFIIAIIVYIAIYLYGIEYPLLLATIIGITDVIPIIGPIIGVFPAGFIILLSQPEKLIPFIIIIILVQQLDGNIISPKILGENTGVSSLCVVIAIATMGTMWGFVGMIVGVPLFATILELTEKFIQKRLKSKEKSAESIKSNDEATEQKKEEKRSERKKLGRLKRYEQRMLRLKQEALADGGIGDLTRFERFQLETYNLACKYNIFSENSEENFALFAAEEEAIAAMVESGLVKDKPVSAQQSKTTEDTKS